MSPTSMTCDLPPELNFCSEFFDPIKFMACRKSIPLPYPKAKTYNNVAEYYYHTFGKNKNGINSSQPSKAMKNRRSVLKRNYAWFYATLGLDSNGFDASYSNYKFNKYKRNKFGKYKKSENVHPEEMIFPEMLQPIRSEKVIVKRYNGSVKEYVLNGGEIKKISVKKIKSIVLPETKISESSSAETVSKSNDNTLSENEDSQFYNEQLYSQESPVRSSNSVSFFRNNVSDIDSDEKSKIGLIYTVYSFRQKIKALQHLHSVKPMNYIPSNNLSLDSKRKVKRKSSTFIKSSHLKNKCVSNEKISDAGNKDVEKLSHEKSLEAENEDPKNSSNEKSQNEEKDIQSLSSEKSAKSNMVDRRSSKIYSDSVCKDVRRSLHKKYLDRIKKDKRSSLSEKSLKLNKDAGKLSNRNTSGSLYKGSRRSSHEKSDFSKRNVRLSNKISTNSINKDVRKSLNTEKSPDVTNKDMKSSSKRKSCVSNKDYDRSNRKSIDSKVKDVESSLHEKMLMSNKYSRKKLNSKNKNIKHSSHKSASDSSKDDRSRSSNRKSTDSRYKDIKCSSNKRSSDSSKNNRSRSSNRKSSDSNKDTTKSSNRKEPDSRIVLKTMLNPIYSTSDTENIPKEYIQLSSDLNKIPNSNIGLSYNNLIDEQVQTIEYSSKNVDRIENVLMPENIEMVSDHLNALDEKNILVNSTKSLEADLSAIGVNDPGINEAESKTKDVDSVSNKSGVLHIVQSTPISTIIHSKSEPESMQNSTFISKQLSPDNKVSKEKALLHRAREARSKLHAEKERITGKFQNKKSECDPDSEVLRNDTIPVNETSFSHLLKVKKSKDPKQFNTCFKTKHFNDACDSKMSSINVNPRKEVISLEKQTERKIDSSVTDNIDCKLLNSSSVSEKNTLVTPVLLKHDDLKVASNDTKKSESLVPVSIDLKLITSTSKLHKNALVAPAPTKSSDSKEMSNNVFTSLIKMSESKTESSVPVSIDLKLVSSSSVSQKNTLISPVLREHSDSKVSLNIVDPMTKITSLVKNPESKSESSLTVTIDRNFIYSSSVSKKNNYVSPVLREHNTLQMCKKSSIVVPDAKSLKGYKIPKKSQPAIKIPHINALKGYRIPKKRPCTENIENR